MEENIVHEKLRNTKITKCVLCDNEIIQGKKEGRLFCNECEIKYEETIKNYVKELGFGDKDFYVLIGNLTCGSNISHKNTIINIHEYKDIKRLQVWIETQNLLKLIQYNSPYIANYIESCIESSYWFVKSVYNYQSNKTNENFEKLLPRYQNGEINLYQFAFEAGVPDYIIKSKLKTLNLL